VDYGGNLYYDAIQVVATNGFYGNVVTNSWLVKIGSAGTVTSQAPSPASQCVTSFDTSQLPWPPLHDRGSGNQHLRQQRAALNVPRAIAPDGTINTVSRAQFNDRYSFRLVLNPDLSPKWIASLRNRFHDGCGVSVADGGWLPTNGTPGECTAGLYKASIR
jgi:hypothetical protein